MQKIILISSPTLSTKLIRQIQRTLNRLWRKNPIETIGKVLEKVNFPQQVLVDAASRYGVGAYPETFPVLLNKILKPEDQEKAVEKCIEELIPWPSEASRLLNTLKGKTFRSERLEYFAIQKTFMGGVERGMSKPLDSGYL